MTILELAKVCNVNIMFFVRDSIRETDVEMGTAAMIVTVGLGNEVQVTHIDVKENALYLTID